ncbi:NADP-specific glutamate dehydrogenase [Alteromonas sp. H39]|uniref:NADP-specific glutamate dehydrogenase n=1 Tax=Alteromonas sp. H39 TaxID=3389876 RepID=UPI0039E10446
MSNESQYDTLISWLETNYPHEPEYLQAVREIVKDILPVYHVHDEYKQHNVVTRLCVPERIIQFSVFWENDNHEIEVHQGWRVQHCGLIGPYKGGLRFHPTVNTSILKFLAFEQTFKNALTGLPMGGAKGGSNFNPKGRSDAEIMRFCQAFMMELHRHIGPNTDVPAGDINVGNREIGYLYGTYRRLENRFEGAITGKHLAFGGSHVRTEATGFGLIYMLKCVLDTHEDSMAAKRIVISGAGNVALHAALKATELEGKVLTLSNSRGFYFNEDGLSQDMIQWAIANKAQEKNVLSALADKFGGEWIKDKAPWDVKADIALPCATQNELHGEHAKALLDNGCQYVLEGANMPCTDEAQRAFAEAQIPYVPGKASNAGGVALSGLEMSQNAYFRRTPFDKLDQSLKDIMQSIHEQCVEEGQDSGWINYSRGANIAAFRRLATAMVAQGV